MNIVNGSHTDKTTAAAMPQQHEAIPGSLPGFDLTEGLNRVAGNTELYKKLLLSFYRDNSNKVQQIKQALETDDVTTARHLVHSIKGVSGNISAKRLFASARDLELQLKQESRENLSECIDQFAAAMDEVLSSLGFLANLETTDSSTLADDRPIDTESIAENIKELAALLGEFNMQAEESFKILNNQLSQRQFQELLHKLDNAISNLEFDSAAEILSGLADKLKIKLS